MNDDQLDVNLGAIDPASGLSDDSLNHLYPSERLEARIALGVEQPASVPPAAKQSRARRLAVTVGAVVILLAIGGTAYSWQSVPSRHIHAVRSSPHEFGRVTYGVFTGSVATSTQSASPVLSPTFGGLRPYCRSGQIKISLTDLLSHVSSNSGWTGTFWFRNVGVACVMPSWSIQIQPVTGVKGSTVGIESVSDLVARSPFELPAGAYAYANASLGSIDAPAPLHRRGSIAQYCSAKRATGLILVGYELHWPNEYFSLGRPVSVCTRWYFNVGAEVLSPVTEQGGQQ